MAVGINSVWECRNTASASNINGCGFNPENASMMTDLQTTGSSGTSATPTVSSATYTFVTNDISSYVYIKSGTSWTPGWYQITAVSSGVATLDAAIGHVVLYIGTGSTRVLQLNTVAGVGTTGALTAGTFTVDYSQQTVAEFSAADLVGASANTATPTVTSSGKPFGRNMVGNFIHITAGTSWTAAIYEILSVSGTTATLDRACGSIAAPTAGTFNVGGAASLCASSGFSDDVFFEQGLGTTGTGSHIFFIRSGSYATMGPVAISASGAFTNPIQIIGYDTYRMDSAGTRPQLSGGANGWTTGPHWWMRDIYYTGTGNPVLATGVSGMFLRVQCVNTSTTVDRAALSCPSAPGNMYQCEAISYRGRAISATAAGNFLGCYVHDSDVGLYSGGGSITSQTFSHCISAGNVTAALKVGAAITTGQVCIQNCTLYGIETPGLGGTAANGITLVSVGEVRMVSNIIYGCLLGSDWNVGVYADYNCYYNNSANTAAPVSSPHDSFVNPAFANMGLLSGTTGAFVAGNGKLVDTTKNFTALGIQPGLDYLHIFFGTGTTIGIYGISAITTTTNPNDTLTLDINPGTDTTANKQYRIVTGHDFYPTGAV